RVWTFDLLLPSLLFFQSIPSLGSTADRRDKRLWAQSVVHLSHTPTDAPAGTRTRERSGPSVPTTSKCQACLAAKRTHVSTPSLILESLHSVSVVTRTLGPSGS